MRVNPEKMAHVYWVRMRFRAKREIENILKNFDHSPASRDYWLIVKSFIESWACIPERKH